VERFLRPINEQLQEFKNWFHHTWHLGTQSGGGNERMRGGNPDSGVRPLL